MLGRHALPCARIAVLECKPLGVGAVAQDHWIGAVLDRPEHIGLEHKAVVHGDVDIPVDLHPVADFALASEHRVDLPVVPAKAETQYSRVFLVVPDYTCPVSVYWVPACAGTTARKSICAVLYYSAVIPAPLMILAHFAKSCAIRSRIASGVPP